MAEEVRKDEISLPADADRHRQRDVTAKTEERGARSKFSLRQDSLAVPKPSYHQHVDDGAELGEPVLEGEDGRDADGPERAYEEAAAAKRTRSQKIRWWGLLLFILLYALFKMVRFDQ